MQPKMCGSLSFAQLHQFWERLAVLRDILLPELSQLKQSVFLRED